MNRRTNSLMRPNKSKYIKQIVYGVQWRTVKLLQIEKKGTNSSISGCLPV